MTSDKLSSRNEPAAEGLPDAMAGGHRTSAQIFASGREVGLRTALTLVEACERREDADDAIRNLLAAPTIEPAVVVDLGHGRWMIDRGVHQGHEALFFEPAPALGPSMTPAPALLPPDMVQPGTVCIRFDVPEAMTFLRWWLGLVQDPENTPADPADFKPVQARVDIAALQAERDDLLRHRAASEAPGWTYQGAYSEGAHLSDAVVALRVRMLMRTDLDHEAVCCMARDRIRDLSREVARQRGLLGSRLPEGDALRILVEVGASESACRIVVPDGMSFDEAAVRVEAAKRAIGAELAEQDRCPFSTSTETR